MNTILMLCLLVGQVDGVSVEDSDSQEETEEETRYTEVEREKDGSLTVTTNKDSGNSYQWCTLDKNGKTYTCIGGN